MNDVAHLHALVTVTDCSTFLSHLASLEDLKDLNMGTSAEDVRPLAFLLAEQVQFANTILVNKTDLVSPAEANKVESLLRHLNPSAELQQTRGSKVDVAKLLAKRSYDEAQFNTMPEWAEELTKNAASGGDGAPVKSEADEYGISHFSVQVVGRPFHAERWHSVLRQGELFAGVLRAKGCFWTTAEPDTRVDYSLVGRSVSLIVNQLWDQVGVDILNDDDFRRKHGWHEDAQAAAAAAVAVQRMEGAVARLKARQVWHPVTEDRRVELVFIGDRDVMDEARLRAEVEAALLTEEELSEFLHGFAQSTAVARGQDAVEENPFAAVPRCVRI